MHVQIHIYIFAICICKLRACEYSLHPFVAARIYARNSEKVVRRGGRSVYTQRKNQDQSLLRTMSFRRNCSNGAG